MLANAGCRLLNTGFLTTPFGERWTQAPALAAARKSDRTYYIDRITGGMPFQPLDGIGDLEQALRDDPHFLGFQAHEWGNSPIHDYHRIHRLLLDQGLPFDEEHFAQYAGRTSMPYFSGGNYAMYRDLYRPLDSLRDVEVYLEAYFRRLVEMTAGQVAAVNGYVQLYHTALRLGAKHVMAEIGNQVPLTALQLACVRGAAKEHGKPFGAYYETWGGAPFGCTCATDFSPWFADRAQFAAFHDMGSVGPEFGSGRSLQRRLLWYAWLSGAAWWVEEWGAENYFANWEDFPLTAYGQVVKEFMDATAALGPVAPVVPAALVLPPGAFGLDVGYLAGMRERPYNLAEPDSCHEKLRQFVQQIYAPQTPFEGSDAQNLTPSPWIGCFDVLSADAPPALLPAYAAVIYLDERQAEQAQTSGPEICCYTGRHEDLARCLSAIRAALPFRIDGEVGCAQARAKDCVLVGLFNNQGVTKTAAGEVLDPGAARVVTVEGPCVGLSMIHGGAYLREVSDTAATLELPAGAVAVLAFVQS